MTYNTTCAKCGRPLYFLNIGCGLEMCWYCYRQHEDNPIKFNYQCPDCHGKFQDPVLSLSNCSTNGLKVYKCPFCGRILVGLAE